MKLRRILRNVGITVSALIVAYVIILLFIGGKMVRKVIDGKSYEARHLFLPGYKGRVITEVKIDVREWMKTHTVNLFLQGEKTPLEREEITALALASSSAFNGLGLLR